MMLGSEHSLLYVGDLYLAIVLSAIGLVSIEVPVMTYIIYSSILSPSTINTLRHHCLAGVYIVGQNPTADQ